MIVCPNCLHQNPEGATQCEACYTALTIMDKDCPNCGSPIQVEAHFCGQCGFNLNPLEVMSPVADMTQDESYSVLVDEPQTSFQPMMPLEQEVFVPSSAEKYPEEISPAVPPPPPSYFRATANDDETFTQIQQASARLVHVLTNTVVELPPHLSVIHVGKPNDRIPPDVDVAGFPHSAVVSRIHADIRVEGDTFFIEDVGSANGTYVNNLPLPPGNRHRLRSGDRIALGKGDLVTFLFQIN